MHKAPKQECVAPSALSLRHFDCSRLHFVAFAPSPPTREALRPRLPRRALFRSLRKRFDFLSQLLAILCVHLSQKANNAQYIHTQMTSSSSLEQGEMKHKTSCRYTEAQANMLQIACTHGIWSSPFHPPPTLGAF